MKNFEEQINIALINSNINAYAIDETGCRHILIQSADDENKYTITTYDTIDILMKRFRTEYDVVNHIVTEYKVNCFMLDNYGTYIRGTR